MKLCSINLTDENKREIFRLIFRTINTYYDMLDVVVNEHNDYVSLDRVH